VPFQIRPEYTSGPADEVSWRARAWKYPGSRSGTFAPGRAFARPIGSPAPAPGRRGIRLHVVAL